LGKIKNKKIKNNTMSDLVYKYLKDIRGKKILTREEEYKYFEQYKNGSTTAYNYIIECNLKLVVNIARRYIGTNNLQLSDLIEEGNLGLIKAVKRFDHKRGIKFSTYAIWWIKQGITRAITCKSTTIRIPVYLQEKISNIIKIKRKFILENKREPTPNELLDEADVTDDIKNQIILNIRVANPLHIDDLIDPCNETSCSFITIMEDKNNENIFNAIKIKQIINILKKKLNELIDNKEITEKQKNIFLYRIGVNDNFSQRTLEKTGIEFHLSRERIRQIQKLVKNKLKQFEEFNNLKNLL